MAIKNTKKARSAPLVDHENQSPVLNELSHPNRKRTHCDTEPDSPSTSRRDRMEKARTPSTRRNGFSPDSNLRQLLNTPNMRTPESVPKKEPESPSKTDTRIAGMDGSSELSPIVASTTPEIVDPASTTAPTKDAAIRSLLDLPRMDQRQTAKTDEPSTLVTPMPRHDPNDSPLMTQLKLHLTYALHKLARNALATNPVPSP
uniref:Flocculation protein FLO11-like n=1 Tax=Haemonchus contortus TaxID=6289 RepID=A0A7I4Y2S9_HAECO